MNYDDTLMNYTVNMVAPTEPPYEITQSQLPKQVYGFLYFNDEDGDLIIAIRCDHIKSFAPQGKQQKPVPTVNRGYGQGQVGR